MRVERLPMATNDIRPKRFEIWYADMPYFDDPSQSKPRPVLVISWDAVMCVAVATKMTSKTWHDDDGDVLLLDWAAAGLRRESVVRCSQVTELARSAFLRSEPYGRLSVRDADNVARELLRLHPCIFS